MTLLKLSDLKIQNLNQVMVTQMLLSWVAPHKKVITEKSAKDAGIDVIPRLNIGHTEQTVIIIYLPKID